MHRRSKFVAPLAAAALLAAVVAGSSAQASTYSAVQATGTEFHLNLSRSHVKPGKLRVEFVNFGEDDHDLAITRKSTGTVTKLNIVHPGDTAAITMPARRGTYVLWCTISDHKAKGMRAVLRVKR
jgi:plastocyanin